MSSFDIGPRFSPFEVSFFFSVAPSAEIVISYVGLCSFIHYTGKDAKGKSE